MFSESQKQLLSDLLIKSLKETINNDTAETSEILKNINISMDILNQLNVNDEPVVNKFKCRRCNTIKILNTDFNIDNHNKNGHKHICKQCEKQLRKDKNKTKQIIQTVNSLPTNIRQSVYQQIGGL